MKKLYLLIILVVCILNISACGSEKDETKQKSDGGQKRSTPTLPVQPTLDNSLNLLDISGQIIYSQNQTLYRVSINSTEPEKLAEYVVEDSINISPNLSHLIYLTHESNQWNWVVYDLQSNTSRPVYENLSVIPTFKSWSSDGTWALLQSYKSFLVGNVENAKTYELEWAEGGIINAVWLENNKLLVHADLGSDMGRSRPPEVFYLDVASGIKSNIELTTETLQVMAFDLQSASRFASLDKELQAQGLSLANSRNENSRKTSFMTDLGFAIEINLLETPEELNFIAPCKQWNLVKKPVRTVALPELLYESPDTAMLSDLTRLDDNAYLFLRWSSQQPCPNFEQDFRADLLYLTVNQEPVVLAWGIDPVWQADASYAYYDDYSYGRNHAFAISPDGKYVAWLGNNSETQEAAIMVTEIATGASTTIIEMDKTDAAFDLARYTNVFWIPE